MDKQGKGGSTNIVSKVIIGVVLMVILFQVVAGTYSTFTTAGNEINTAGGGTGLSALFASDSVMPLLLLAGILIVAVTYLMGFMGHKR